MLGNIIVLVIIGLLIVLALASIKKHGINRCSGCSGDCKSCEKIKEINKILKEMKEE